MAANDRKEFARKLQTLMLKKGWNQSELARRAGIGRDNVSGYMRAKNVPNSKHLNRLADAVGVAPDSLYKGLIIEREDSDEYTFEVQNLRNDPSKTRLRINMIISTEAATEIIAILTRKKN